MKRTITVLSVNGGTGEAKTVEACCKFCRYFNLNDRHIEDQGICYRMPKSEIKNMKMWCGEFVYERLTGPNLD